MAKKRKNKKSKSVDCYSTWNKFFFKGKLHISKTSRRESNKFIIEKKTYWTKKKKKRKSIIEKKVYWTKEKKKKK